MSGRRYLQDIIKNLQEYYKCPSCSINYHFDDIKFLGQIDAKLDRVEGALNELNDRYGEETVIPAKVLASKNPMKDKIPFGSIRYFS